MITRKQYRGCFKPEASFAEIEKKLQRIKENIEKKKEENKILTVCIYRWKQMCFVYAELLDPEQKPEDYLAELEPFMEVWPEEEKKTPWAPMYHIYHHQEPGSAEDWLADRHEGKTRIGRIAFLKPEKLFSYTYWHYAIVEEGLLKGDRYQFISLHENILFSYFEEPRTNVNCRGTEKQSEVINGWMAVDPESHFDRERAGGNNFRIIDPILIV